MTRAVLPHQRLSDAWLATFTRRWHANPDLCHTVDPVSAHSARMGIMALTFWGGNASRELLAACLVHDLGERWVGDVPHPAKRDPDFRIALDRLEACALADLGLLYDISNVDARRLRFLDRLDAYLWAQKHASHVLSGDGWPEQRAWLLGEASELGAVVEAIAAEAA